MRIESRAAPKERPVLVSAAILRLELRMRLRTPFIFAFCAAVAMLGAAPLAAARDGSTPPSGGEDNSAGDNVIDIPGIGQIPIPLPPGSRVFGPGGAPKQKPAAPSPREPPTSTEPARACVSSALTISSPVLQRRRTPMRRAPLPERSSASGRGRVQTRPIF